MITNAKGMVEITQVKNGRLIQKEISPREFKMLMAIRSKNFMERNLNSACFG